MPSRRPLKDYFPIWLALVLMGLSLRPLTPVDETRAVTVAWEMWLHNDFLVPHLNGEAYSHKPPLLQWCIYALWLVFGVNEWSARLISPLFALANLILTETLAKRLWADDKTTAKLSPLILLAIPVWALWSSLTLYDMMVTFFTLLGLHGIIRAARGEFYPGWGLTALAIGGGVLSKGPAILIMILPTALLAPWWLETKPRWGRWYSAMLGAILLGALLALTWAIPAGFAGGEEYRKAIFWGQSAGRISNSFAHKLPFWWYLALLPVLWLPWMIWPPLWRSVKNCGQDSGLRFCVVQVVLVLLVFSLISGKRIHYLLPIFPAMALFAARTLSLTRPLLTRRDWLPIGLLLALAGLALLLLPSWGAVKSDLVEIATQTPLVAKLFLLGLGLAMLFWNSCDTYSGVHKLAMAMLGVMFTAHLAYRQAGWSYYHMQPFADHLATVEKQGATIAHWGEYHGDFNFLGRLQHPLVEIDTAPALQNWMETHRDGYVVLVRQPNLKISEDGAEFAQFYRGTRRVMLWKSTELLNRPETLAQMIAK